MDDPASAPFPTWVSDRICRLMPHMAESNRIAWVLPWIWGLALFLGSAAAQAEARPWWAGELSAAAGLDWSEGNYDEPGEDTEILYLPFSLTYRLDDLSLTSYPLDQLELRATVPYLEIDTPLAFFEEQPAGDRALSSQMSRERGLGDVVLSGTYAWFPLDERWPAWELTGKVKLPTADEDRNLGTGGTDYFVQIDSFKSWGRLTGFANAGYRFPGNPPNGNLRNTGYASGGFSARVAPRLAGGAYYSWSAASTASRHDSHELIGFTSLRLTDSVSLEPYAVWGLSGYVPDYAVGFSIRARVSFGRN